MTVEKLLVCTNCGDFYTHTKENRSYSLAFIGYLLSDTKLSCSVCKREAVIPQQITATIRHDVFFNAQEETKKAIEPVEMYDTEKEYVLLQLTWVCNICSFSWTTKESFISTSTKQIQTAFLETDKCCPGCSSDSVTLFDEREY